MNESLGLLEITGLTPAMVALDVMEKRAHVRVLQCELNDYYGVCIKVAGDPESVATAVAAGRDAARQMGGQPVATVIPRCDSQAMRAITSPPEFNPLIQQDVVFYPSRELVTQADAPEELSMSQERPQAVGLIETQGFTAVFEAIDTACKAANVEVVGKEKLGGGYITVIVKGDLAAVTAAIEAGQAKVDGLGKLIAAHVLAHPSDSVLQLLPKL